MGLRTQSVGRIYDEEKNTDTSAVKYRRFGIDDTGSLDVYVVKTGQDVLGTESVGGAYGGDDFLCE